MYFCMKGIDGVGKSTQTLKLKDTLASRYNADKICITSEPCSKNAMLTMKLRSLMLDAAWDAQMTKEAREYL